jgi:plasmid stabilization system protein ParE
MPVDVTVAYAPQALRDIGEILACIHRRSPTGAHNASLTTEPTIDLSAFAPLADSKTDEPSIYRRSLGKYRCTIYYRVSPEGAGTEVVRVVHGARMKALGTVPDDA